MAEPTTKFESPPVQPATPPEQSAAYFTLREAAVFGSIVGAILLSANAYVCATWSFFFGVPGWIAWQAGPGVIALAFIPATILRFRWSHPALRFIYALSATWLGALNFAFFAAVGCWIAAGVSWLAGWRLPYFSTAAILFGLAGGATIYGVINGRWIRITRLTIRLAHLPEAWQGRTAALITDLHLGPLFGAGFLRRVLDRLRGLRPDVVFISGDMFDGSPLGLDQLIAPWRDFSVPRGIYYVTGNHDEFAERNLFTEAVQRTGIQVVNNEKIVVEGLQVIGVHDAEAGNPATLREILRQEGIDPARASILLAHRPVNLAIAEEAGVSLQLSGHTHGGQVWPWNLLVARIYGRFAAGLGRRGSLQVYTSNGVGTWGPPLRVATKSEIVLIRLEKD